MKHAGVDSGLEELQHDKLLFLLTVNIIDLALYIILTYHLQLEYYEISTLKIVSQCEYGYRT